MVLSYPGILTGKIEISRYIKRYNIVIFDFLEFLYAVNTSYHNYR